LAGAIIAYRNQHGAFDSPADLQKIYTLDSITLKKIVPYLLFK
jgi:DNA uptake protein ComE-like DNA-binding protein